MKLFTNRDAVLEAMNQTPAGERPDFSHCAFVNVDLSGLDFRAADLHHSRFKNCDLRAANLDGCQLDFVDLFLVDLSSGSMVGATVNFAMFTAVLMIDTVIADVRWENARLHRVTPAPIEVVG